jgi:cellobiose phosphorylase
MKNPYGHFDDKNREYVITRPDTPLPWLNYIGQEEYFGLVTNTSGGYSFWRDAKLRRLTRYRYNDIPYDSNGRYLYIKDGDTVWNPGWKPTKTALDSYECRHGLGYTKFKSEKKHVQVEMKFFVPPGENLEIWKTTVRNAGKTTKRLKLFSFVEFCLYEASNDMNNLQRTFSIGEVEVEKNGAEIYHKTEYRERRNHYTLFGCTGNVTGFDTDRDVFLGMHNGLHEAKVPFSGKATNTIAHGWSPCGSHQIELTLKPGEKTSFAFILAYVEQTEPKYVAPFVINKSCGKAIMEKYATIKAVDAAFERLAEYWNKNLSIFQCETPDKHLNRMGNIWNQYQCMATFNLSRSASLFETGIGRGMGYRDSNQDTLGFGHMIPSRVKERLCDIARTQLSDGTCYHQYQPLTKQGNKEIGGDFYDDHLWLIQSITFYIKETGDTSILNEKIGYYDKKDDPATMLDHLELSAGYTMSHRGPHKLPLIGHADWNDCLNLNCFSTEPNESFQCAGDVKDSKAESVMIAGLFLYTTNLLAELYDFLKKPEDAKRIRAMHAEMDAAVTKSGWDGEWFVRAYDAQSKPVGSHVCNEGKIYIESQGWCVLGGNGIEDGRAKQAMESVQKYLKKKNGCVLQWPAYNEYHVELGEVSSYPPGYKENGGIFCHNNPWIILALSKLGMGDRAFEYYTAICPSTKEAMIDVYKGEPYVYSQMVSGSQAPVEGEAKNSWLTGTAAWTFLALAHGILGIVPQFEGLSVDPCIPSTWDGFKATRIYRGTTYHITVKNPKGVQKGVKQVKIGGKAIKGNILPIQTGKTLEVEVTLG